MFARDLRILFSVALLGVACSQESGHTTKNDVFAEVREAWISLYNARDAVGLAKYFEEDAELLNPGESIITGRDSMKPS